MVNAAIPVSLGSVRSRQLRMSLPSDEMACEIDANIPERSSKDMSTSTCEVGALEVAELGAQRTSISRSGW